MVLLWSLTDKRKIYRQIPMHLFYVKKILIKKIPSKNSKIHLLWLKN